jgi:hypothetical protein
LRAKLKVEANFGMHVFPQDALQTFTTTTTPVQNDFTTWTAHQQTLTQGHTTQSTGITPPVPPPTPATPVAILMSSFPEILVHSRSTHSTDN